MTISSQVTSIQPLGNGTTTQYSFGNKIFLASDLVVTLIDTLGNLYPFVNQANATLSLSYTVQNVDVDTGCQITFSAAPPNGWTVDIRTQVGELQSTSIKNQGSFLPELHEEALDKLTREVQDLKRLAYTFSVHGQDIESIAWPTLPLPSQRQNTALGFNGAGALALTTPIAQSISLTQLDNLGTDTGVVNAYVIGVTSNIPVTLTLGALVRVIVLNTNNGPSTANVAGLGVEPIVNDQGNALTGGEMLSTVPTWLQWTGAAWQVVGSDITPDKARTALEIANGVTAINYSFVAPDIRRYQAVPGSDCSSIVTTAASCNSWVLFPNIGATAWVINSTPTIPNGVILEAAPGAIFSGAGATALGLPTTNTIGFQFTDFNPLAPHSGVGELASFNYFRNATSTVTASGVANAVRIQTNVAAGVQNFEWGFLSILNNSATGGQNVAGYFQANKNGNIGPTWGAVIQINETVAINGPTAGTVALEIDQLGNGTDTTGGNRVGIDLVIEKYNNSGAGYVCTWGYRCSAGISDAGASKVGFGFGFTPGSYAIVGFDTSHATIATASIQMAQGQGIIFDGPTTQANALVYDGTGLSYKVSGVVETRLLASGGLAVNTSGVATQVVGPQISGYGTPTGGSHQASFNAATITLANLAAWAAQLTIDLKTHGLLGA